MTGIFLISMMVGVVLLWVLQHVPSLLKYTILVLYFSTASYLYYELGAAGKTDFPAQHLQQDASENRELRNRMDDLILFLQHYPDNCEGWVLLEKAYQTLGSTIEAGYVGSYRKQICKTG